VQAAPLLGLRPADPAVADAGLQGGGLPADERNPGFPDGGDVAQGVAEEAAERQVVMPVDQAVPEAVLAVATGEAHLDGPQVRNGYVRCGRPHASTMTKSQGNVQSPLSRDQIVVGPVGLGSAPALSPTAARQKIALPSNQTQQPVLRWHCSNGCGLASTPAQIRACTLTRTACLFGVPVGDRVPGACPQGLTRARAIRR